MEPAHHRLSRLAGLLIWAALFAHGQDDQPRVVTPGLAGGPPADAVALFDGTDMSQWEARDGDPSRCKVESGVLSCLSGSGNLFSRKTFGSAQIHLEFAVPDMPDHNDQFRGNSGVYLHGRYEIQILDSYRNPTYPTGACGALYGQAAPMVNASRPPEQWQSFDITYRAPRCDKQGRLVEHGAVSLLHNGVLVLDHVRILGSESSCEKDKEGVAEGPLMLQDHSGFPDAPVTLMRFRNIWFRPLD